MSIYVFCANGRICVPSVSWLSIALTQYLRVSCAERIKRIYTAAIANSLSGFFSCYAPFFLFHQVRVANEGKQVDWLAAV